MDVFLSRHLTPDGARWALDGRLLPPDFSLGLMLQLPKSALPGFLAAFPAGPLAAGTLLAPIERDQEVWACGVTYERSREAREAESAVKDVYSKVYEAARPEVFWKSIGWRVSGHGMPIRVRDDSRWNVPEPELTLVVNSGGEIVGFCCGNDVSSRDIEGENPLYVPQAKVYNGSCAVGPVLRIGDTERLKDLTIKLAIRRGGKTVFEGETETARIKRPLEELVGYLGKELDFPDGVLVLTGTGIVPGAEFSLSRGDVVAISIAGMTLENEVAAA